MTNQPIDGFHSAQGLRWSGHTDRGKVRVNNEDSFLAMQFNSREVHYLGKIGEAPIEFSDFAFAVSDGMGGAMAGEYASRITTEKITRLLPRSFQQSAQGLEAGFTELLTELFDQIHRSLVLVGGSYEECQGMQATLSLCWFTPKWMFFGHIGDTRIYYLPARKSEVQLLTHDDTHVGWLLRQGQITEWQARNHPRRNVLQKSLGADNQFVEPQVGAVGYERGDRFLLCSDGLTEGLYDHQLSEELRGTMRLDTLANPARKLVDIAIENSGKDNTTALVIEVL